MINTLKRLSLLVSYTLMSVMSFLAYIVPMFQDAMPGLQQWVPTQYYGPTMIALTALNIMLHYHSYMYPPKVNDGVANPAAADKAQQTKQSGSVQLDLLILALIIAFIVCTFYAGRESVKYTDRKAQVSTLKNDAKAVTNIDNAQDKRHAKNAEITKQAKVEIPLDAFNQLISVDAVDRLCSAGADCP